MYTNLFTYFRLCGLILIAYFLRCSHCPTTNSLQNIFHQLPSTIHLFPALPLLPPLCNALAQFSPPCTQPPCHPLLCDARLPLPRPTLHCPSFPCTDPQYSVLCCTTLHCLACTTRSLAYYLIPSTRTFTTHIHPEFPRTTLLLRTSYPPALIHPPLLYHLWFRAPLL